MSTPVNYAIPSLLAVLPVIYYRVRGRAFPAEGGALRVAVDPGQVQHVLFIRKGSPIAVGTCHGVVRDPRSGTWLVNYSNVVGLQTPVTE